jgi:hypothetical protein
MTRSMRRGNIWSAYRPTGSLRQDYCTLGGVINQTAGHL